MCCRKRFGIALFYVGNNYNSRDQTCSYNNYIYNVSGMTLLSTQLFNAKFHDIFLVLITALLTIPIRGCNRPSFILMSIFLSHKEIGSVNIGKNESS